MTVARILFHSCWAQIFLVADMLHPLDRRAVQRFLDRDVSHCRGVGRAVPVLVVRRAPDDVAGADFLARFALALVPANACRDDQRLAERVYVPGGPRTPLEGDAGDADTRRLGRITQRLDPDVAGKPIRWTLLRGPHAVADDGHDDS